MESPAEVPPPAGKVEQASPRGARAAQAGETRKPLRSDRGRPPHVVILVENLPVPLDRRVWQEATALHRAGWMVTVIGPRGAGEMQRLRDTINGIDVLRYPQRPASRLRGYLVEYAPSLFFSALWLLRTRMRGPIDVIQGCNPPDLFWLLGLMGRSWGARYVFDQHDANPELSRTKFGERGVRARVLNRLTRWLEQRSYDTASLVIAPNDSYATLARTRGGVAAERLALVRNAPNVARYRALAEGVPRRPHAVGYVGVMGSQEGLELLLRAWAEVVKAPDLDDARLELVGDGEARAALERQMRGLGLEDSVTFHGYLRPEQFVPILASCAVCVSPDPPTPFNDVSTMVKVVDYIAMGRGIVAFDLHETQRVGAGAVEVVPAADPHALAGTIIALLTNPDRIVALEESAARRAEELNLDWDVSARQLVSSYRRLLGERLPGASAAGG